MISHSERKKLEIFIQKLVDAEKQHAFDIANSDFVESKVYTASKSVDRFFSELHRYLDELDNGAP